MVDREDELAVGAGRHADRLDARHAAEVALEAGDAATLTRPATTTRVDAASLEARLALCPGTRPASRAARASSAIDRDLLVGVRRLDRGSSRPRPRRRRSPATGRARSVGDPARRAQHRHWRCRTGRRCPRLAGALSRRSRRRPRSRWRARPSRGRACRSTRRRSGRRCSTRRARASRPRRSLRSRARPRSARPRDGRLDRRVGDGRRGARLDRGRLVGPGAVGIERRRLGQALGHGREAGRVLLGQQPLEERRHLGLEAARPAAGRARCAPRSAAACDSISRSRTSLRWVMRSSVSSRIRAISAFDHSRIEAMSSSAFLRRSAASSAELAWMLSMWVFASALKRSRVSARADSAAACMALVRSAMNLFGLRVAGAALVASGGSALGAAADDGSEAVSEEDGAVSVIVGVSCCGVGWAGRVAGTVRRRRRRPAVSDSFRSALQGSRKPLFASVVAIRWDPREMMLLGGSGAWSASCQRWSGVVESARGTSGLRRSYRCRAGVTGGLVYGCTAFSG